MGGHRRAGGRVLPVEGVDVFHGPVAFAGRGAERKFGRVGLCRKQAASWVYAWPCGQTSRGPASNANCAFR